MRVHECDTEKYYWIQSLREIYHKEFVASSLKQSGGGISIWQKHDSQYRTFQNY